VHRLLLKLGFVLVRTTGAHRRYQHADGRATTLAWHTGHDIPIGTLRSIVDDISISVEEFNQQV
jgi:predicted RNA binding protein YcfA (HicA-like mRNA interferase family)